MSYYAKLRERILTIKGVFFLSPREIWFLKTLEDLGYPFEAVKEGLERFFSYVPPERRSKTPIYFAMKEIEKLKKRISKSSVPVKDWREKFRELVELARTYLKDLKVEEPQKEEEAELILRQLEKEVYKHLWNILPQEEKKDILKKYKAFKNDEEVFRLMVKGELKRRFGLKTFSLYVEEYNF